MYQYISLNSFSPIVAESARPCSLSTTGFVYHAALQIKDSPLPRAKAQHVLRCRQGPSVFWLTLDSSATIYPFALRVPARV